MSVRVTDRDEAGLPPSDANYRPTSAVVGVTVHYSTGEERGAPEARRWWRNIWSYHVGTRRYDDVAYHFGIDMRTGEVLEGRPVNRVGAHSSGHNYQWLGVCFLGDDDAGYQDVSDAAWTSFWRLLTQLERDLGRGLRLETHRVQKERQGGGTACPGNEIAGRLTAGRPQEDVMVNPDLVIYARRGVDFDTASSVANARGGAGCVVTLDAVLAQRWVDSGVRTVALGGGSVKDLRGEVEVVGEDALETMIDGARLAG